MHLRTEWGRYFNGKEHIDFYEVFYRYGCRKHNDCCNFTDYDIILFFKEFP